MRRWQYRGAAVICGVDHKTVERALGRSAGREAGAHNYDIVADGAAKRVAASSAPPRIQSFRMRS